MKKGNVLEKQQWGEEGEGSFTGWYSRSGSFRSLVVEFQSREAGTEPESCSHLWDHGL